MKTRVTSRGVLLPKRLLEGIDEVEIRKENDLILVVPLAADDPIFKLGEQPIVGDVTDAPEQHDRNLYNFL